MIVLFKLLKKINLKIFSFIFYVVLLSLGTIIFIYLQNVEFVFYYVFFFIILLLKQKEILVIVFGLILFGFVIRLANFDELKEVYKLTGNLIFIQLFVLGCKFVYVLRREIVH